MKDYYGRVLRKNKENKREHVRSYYKNLSGEEKEKTEYGENQYRSLSKDK